MGDKEIVLALVRGLRQHFAEGLGSSVVFIWRHHEAALRQVDCFLDVLESCSDGRLVSSIELARVDFPNRQSSLADCIAKRLCQLLALVVEVSLLGDIIEIEWIGIRLVRERRTMPDDNVIAPCT